MMMVLDLGPILTLTRDIKSNVYLVHYYESREVAEYLHGNSDAKDLKWRL